MVKDMPLASEASKPIRVEPYRKFDTLDAAFVYANNLTNDLLRNGQKVVFSSIAADLFKKPRSRQVQILGVSRAAGEACAKIAPGGKWWVACDEDNGVHRFMAWYSKYTPYAYAMMRCEDGFEAQGIDYQSINSYFKSCMGFVHIGQGEGDVKTIPPDVLLRLASGEDARDFVELKECHVIEDEDLDLYAKLYRASMAIKSPGLPFDEALQPACCFVAFRRPDLFVKFIGRGRKRPLSECLDDWRYRHAVEVFGEVDLPVPEFPWGRRAR